MDDLIFYSMASGSSGNCYFFGNGNYGFLVDAGISSRQIRKYLVEADIPVSQVRALFITHIHKDHTQSMSSIGNRWNIPVFTTKKTFLEIDKAPYIHRSVNVGNRFLIEHDERVQLGDFFITSFFVPHDVDDNSGFVIEYKGRKIVLATDVGHVSPLLEEIVKQADYLIIESNHDTEMLWNGSYPQILKERIASDLGHLNNKDAAALVASYRKENLKQIFLCHLSESNNNPNLAVETMRFEIEQNAKQKGETIPNISIVALNRKSPMLFNLK